MRKPNEGDQDDAFYIIVDGAVKVYVSSLQGEEMVLTTLRPLRELFW